MEKDNCVIGLPVLANYAPERGVGIIIFISNTNELVRVHHLKEQHNIMHLVINGQSQWYSPYMASQLDVASPNWEFIKEKQCTVPTK